MFAMEQITHDILRHNDPSHIISLVGSSADYREEGCSSHADFSHGGIFSHSRGGAKRLAVSIRPNLPDGKCIPVSLLLGLCCGGYLGTWAYDRYYDRTPEKLSTRDKVKIGCAVTGFIAGLGYAIYRFSRIIVMEQCYTDNFWGTEIDAFLATRDEDNNRHVTHRIFNTLTGKNESVFEN